MEKLVRNGMMRPLNLDKTLKPQTNGFRYLGLGLYFLLKWESIGAGDK